VIERGVYFGDIHSFRDLNLVLAPFDYTPAQPKFNFIEIPGGNGSIDATESTGEITYSDREFEFVFSVFPNDNLTFEERQTLVANAINGKRCNIILEKDPDYFWAGRVWVDKYASNKRLKQINVTARVAPYKLKRQETVIKATLTGEAQTIILPNECKRVCPAITLGASSTATIVYRSISIPLTESGQTVKALDLQLLKGDNILTVTGQGEITFTYREGAL
jgi:hypothetical protein